MNDGDHADVAGADSPPMAASQEQWLIDYLREQDVSCPGCGYNLRGLTSGRCPECGQALRLGVHLAEPYLKAWITLLAGVGASGGMGCFFAVAIVRSGLPDAPHWILTAAIMSQIVMIPTIPIVIWTRRRFLRLERKRQWLLAGLGIGVPVLAIVLMAIAMD